jgi:hypothetical protein
LGPPLVIDGLRLVNHHKVSSAPRKAPCVPPLSGSIQSPYHYHCSCCYTNSSGGRGGGGSVDAPLLPLCATTTTTHFNWVRAASLPLIPPLMVMWLCHLEQSALSSRVFEKTFYYLSPLTALKRKKWEKEMHLE